MQSVFDECMKQNVEHAGFPGVWFSAYSRCCNWSEHVAPFKSSDWLLSKSTYPDQVVGRKTSRLKKTMDYIHPRHVNYKPAILRVIEKWWRNTCHLPYKHTALTIEWSWLKTGSSIGWKALPEREPAAILHTVESLRAHCATRHNSVYRPWPTGFEPGIFRSRGGRLNH